MKGILLDENNDLLINKGRLTLGETVEQCAGLILETEQGEWKEYPRLGASLSQYVKSNATDREISQRVTVSLEYDNINAEVEVRNSVISVKV